MRRALQMGRLRRYMYRQCAAYNVYKPITYIENIYINNTYIRKNFLYIGFSFMLICDSVL